MTALSLSLGIEVHDVSPILEIDSFMDREFHFLEGFAFLLHTVRKCLATQHLFLILIGVGYSPCVPDESRRMQFLGR